MSRFHVYRLKREDVLTIDLQADLLSNLPSRMMAPLYRVKDMNWAMSRLTPRFDIDGTTYVMATQRMAAVETNQIGEMVADLTSKADEIAAALDFLFLGF
jgi:toxin CcdB